MEGGSTRMGSRSSTRHGPGSVVFQGPVRKWRKSWAPIVTTSATHASSRVLLYKWSPISVSKDDAAEEQLNSPAIRFVPVSVILARKMEEEKQEREQELEEDDDAGGQADMDEDKDISS
ncbi:uncharacterized protein LOC112350400 [Selaginella moellendorffii]|uniref:uncharacterized protein LOC112343805 n=1 Tax=Selaginella moellendorffii TaxID=88036 RepID=UPI000D1C8C03|nr:uncharacterized protein LOC112343805 [Selaginella moellendorffii]XP_024542311.1 uncharacterized protein LOC112350400 [Selaginella moellendorffii]|eukprot:XP_024523615.1 uncharacterized protein LOC112343805 [Selaginella moellendorffii]